MNNGMMKSLQLVAVLALLLASNPASAARPLTVAVASSMTYAFHDLAVEFKNMTGIVVNGVFGSSGKLYSQISNGAPFDVLLSADMEEPQKLYQNGLAMMPPKAYAKGLLVLWTMNHLDLGRGIQVLNDPEVQKIAVASPGLAPYGREAINALEHFGLQEAVKPKLVYGESISQVNQYIDSASVDIGFTAKSVVLAPETGGRGMWIELPTESYRPIVQGAVILVYGFHTNFVASRRFLQFLASPSAREIFDKYGYLPP